MTDEETLGRQVAPHRRLRIFLLFLVLDRIVNMCHFISRYATFMMNRDIADLYILHRMVRQARDAAAH